MSSLQQSLLALQAAAAEQERARRVPALKAEGREVTARARALQERRAAIAAALPADLLARYQRLHAALPPAVVAIRGGTCSGCGVAVPTALQQRVAAGEIIPGLSCGRLLAEGSPHDRPCRAPLHAASG